MKERIKSLPFFGDVALILGEWWRQTKRKTRKYIAYLRNKKHLRPNAVLKNRFKGKRAFILASGPSIKNQDLSKLSGEFCISVSNFFVHPDFKKIKPEYHVFAESHTPITDNQMTLWLRDAEKHFPVGQKVVMAVGDKCLVDKDTDLFKDVKTYYYDINGYHFITAAEDIDFTKRIPTIQSVAHQAIYLALYSGASEIYLIGCDHDTILHLGEDRHFYKKDESVLIKSGVNEWSVDWEAHFAAYARLWKVYKKIRAYADWHKTKIYNSTPGSLLDVFPRINLSDVIFSPLSSNVQKRVER